MAIQQKQFPSAEKIALYDKLIATNPYTAYNANMFTQPSTKKQKCW